MSQFLGSSRRLVLAGLVSLCASIGCTDAKMSSKPAAQPAAVTQQEPAKNPAADDKPVADKATETDVVLAERKKLGAEDRKLVDAQEWCVISDDARLGEMGAPIKLSIKGEPVFVCCKSCKKDAEANPDKTLAKVKELKAKKAAADKKS